MYVCMYVWLCWVFVSVQGLSLVVASGGHSSSRCTGHSLSRPLLLRSAGSRRAGSVIVAHGPSCSAACGIFPDQGSNLRPLRWQADSQPLRRQGSPRFALLKHLRPFLSSLPLARDNGEKDGNHILSTNYLPLYFYMGNINFKNIYLVFWSLWSNLAGTLNNVSQGSLMLS